MDEIKRKNTMTDFRFNTHYVVTKGSDDGKIKIGSPVYLTRD